MIYSHLMITFCKLSRFKCFDPAKFRLGTLTQSQKLQKAVENLGKILCYTSLVSFLELTCVNLQGLLR